MLELNRRDIRQGQLCQGARWSTDYQSGLLCDRRIIRSNKASNRAERTNFCGFNWVFFWERILYMLFSILWAKKRNRPWTFSLEYSELVRTVEHLDYCRTMCIASVWTSPGIVGSSGALTTPYITLTGCSVAAREIMRSNDMFGHSPKVWDTRRVGESFASTK